MNPFPNWLPDFINQFNSCQSQSQMTRIESLYLNKKSPIVNHYISNWYKRKGDQEKAYSLILSGVQDYIKYSVKLETSDIWNSPLIDSVGQMLAMLYVEYDSKDFSKEIKKKILRLSYMYLFRQILQFSDRSPDSFWTAAVILTKNRLETEHLIMESLGMGINTDVLVFSNWFNASKAYFNINNHSDASKAKAKADNILRDLEGISISGKDAEDYQPLDLSNIGLQRNLKIYSNIFESFKKQDLQLTLSDLGGKVGFWGRFGL